MKKPPYHPTMVREETHSIQITHTRYAYTIKYTSRIYTDSSAVDKDPYSRIGLN